MARVFVYGTLKKGQPNHFRMTDKRNGKAVYCCSASTVEKFPLIIAGKYNIPFLLNIPGVGRQVEGEVYNVDSQMLHFLDEFEGCPHMYQRTLVELEVKQWAGESTPSGQSADAPRRMEAFVYSTTTYQPEWLSLPVYESYNAYGNHGLVFVGRESRV